MPTKLIWFTGIFTILLNTSFAQLNSTIISGIVRTAGNEAVMGASVVLKGASYYTATTDTSGKFQFHNIAAGNYHLEIQALGMTPVRKEIAVKNGDNQTLKFSMEDELEEMKEVSIVGKTENQKVNTQAFNITSIDAKKLYNTNLDLSHTLDRVAGVRVREGGGVGSRIDFSLNGFNGRQVKFFLDGVPMDNFGSSFQINNIPVNLAERIEVYKGVVPIWLGSDALGGAVNIVTSNKFNTYLDASYSYGSFNTHRSVVNTGYTSRSGFTTQLNIFQNYSDNNYWVTVDASDIKTGRYYKDSRVRRFHDNYHNETAIANVGVVGKKIADKLLFGITLGRNRAEIQTGARMVSVFGECYRTGNIIMPSIKYQKKNFLIKGLDLTLNANYNLGSEQNVDTVNRRYNWFGQFKSNPGAGSERSRSLYKFRNNNGLVTANFNYHLSGRSTITLNNVYNTFNRKGSDELFPENEAYEQPKINTKNVLGLGYKYDYNEKWNTSLFLKYFQQANRFSQSYNPNTTSEVAYRLITNKFENMGYGIASTYFIGRLQLKASFEKSYRLPDTDELYGDMINMDGNPTLKPEKSYNYNLGLGYTLQLNERHHFNLDANILYRDARDFIRPTLNSNQTKTISANVDNVTNQGLDGELRYSFRKIFTAGMNATYQNLRNNTKYEPNQTTESILYKDRIPNMPFCFGNGFATLYLKKITRQDHTLSVGYNLLYVHGYYLFWPSMGEGKEKMDIPMQLSHDVNIVYSLANGKYNIALECKNIMDSRLYDNFSLQKPGRAIYVKLRCFFSKK